MLTANNLFCSYKINQGGGVAAPIASQVLGEVLPYLDIKKDNEAEEDTINKVTVPNLEGLTIPEAENVLKECGLNLDVSENISNVENAVISEQIPVKGVEVFEGSNVIVK